MKPVAAIVESATDIAQLAREIAREHIALQDCERKLDESERKSEGLRELQRRHRVEIGRMLIEAKRSIKHGGWLPYLEKLGIGDRSARDWMALAGYVGKSEPNENGSDLPTRREVNEARKAPRADEQPDPPPALHPEPRQVAPSLDISSELSKIQDKLCAAAQTAPRGVRQQIAFELRETARLIEEMP